jgi:hypothetical protein
MSTENEDNKAQHSEQERIQRSIDQEFEVRTEQSDHEHQIDLPPLDNHYRVKNVKYGEKTVVGRVIGRNKTVIPEEEVAELSKLHCSYKEMADFYSVPLQTFVDNFRDIITKNRLITKQRLRKAQLDLALNKHDRVMLIWLGKQMLSQSENPMGTDDNQVLPWITQQDEDE